MLEFKLPNTGIGSTICILSVLIHSAQQIRLHIPPNSLAPLICQIYGFNLELIDDTGVCEELGFSDFCKFHSPYPQPTHITLWNNIYATGQRQRPMIGVAMTNNEPGALDLSGPDQKFPYFRYADRATYHVIIDLLQKSGYDFVTLDTKKLDLQQKIYLLNEFCDCVIAYEGGIAHVAHTLRIPVIMLPWRNDHWIRDNYAPHMAQLMHRDDRTWFLDHDEIKEWDRSKLNQVIALLHGQQGNSVFLPQNQHSDRASALSPSFSDFDRDFLDRYILC